MKKFIRCAVVALMLTPGAGAAQDFDAGLKAANAGDYAAALQEWRPLAEQGDIKAQYNLGVMYQNGYGVPQDYAEALRWYRMAAEQGHADARYSLGVMYHNGYGVPQDDAEAVKWYRLAAEQGNADAQYNLGNSYFSGQGVPQDHVSAHMWLNIAAANGAENAARNRNILANWMTATDISEAQRRARVCMASSYQDCD